MNRLQDKDLNFLTVLQKESSRNDPDRSRKTFMFMAPTVLLIVFLMVTLYLRFDIMSINNQIADYNAKTEAIMQSEEYQKVNQGVKFLEDSEAYYLNTLKLDAVKRSYPLINADVVQNLLDNLPEGASLTTMSYTSRYAYFNFGGEVNSEWDVSTYNENLRNSGRYNLIRENTYQNREGNVYAYDIYANLYPGTGLLDVEGMVETDDE